MNRICTTCNIKIDENNYFKDKLFAKVVTIKLEEKTTIKL